MCKEKNHGHHSIEEIAKQHNMTVEEFTKKSGLKFNEDGSHSLEGHTMEMFRKEYSQEELKELAKQHDMSVEDMQKHIDIMKKHH